MNYIHTHSLSFSLFLSLSLSFSLFLSHRESEYIGRERERERVCVCVREREREREREIVAHGEPYATSSPYGDTLGVPLQLDCNQPRLCEGGGAACSQCMLSVSWVQRISLIVFEREQDKKINHRHTA